MYTILMLQSLQTKEIETYVLQGSRHGRQTEQNGHAYLCTCTPVYLRAYLRRHLRVELALRVLVVRMDLNIPTPRCSVKVSRRASARAYRTHSLVALLCCAGAGQFVLAATAWLPPKYITYSIQ